MKKQINVRWGKREVEITKIELFNKFDKKSNIFVSGDPLKIRIYYKNNKDIEVVDFGIGIFYKNGSNFIINYSNFSNKKS